RNRTRTATCRARPWRSRGEKAAVAALLPLILYVVLLVRVLVDGVRRRLRRDSQRQRPLQGLHRGPPVDQRTRAPTSGRIDNLGVQAHGAEPFIEPAGAGIRFVHP